MKNRFFLLVAGFCLLAPSVHSQDKILSAFSQSLELESKGEYAKAIASLKEVYDEKSYEINLRLGWLSYEAAQYVESTNYYEKSMNIMPYSIQAKLGYALPASVLGNWDKVVVQYKKILEIDPQNSTVNYRMGLIEYNNKRYTSAFKFFEKVVNLYPFDYDGLLMFAWTNFQLGKTREAKILFTKVLMLVPKDASATEGLGLVK